MKKSEKAGCAGWCPLGLIEGKAGRPMAGGANHRQSQEILDFSHIFLAAEFCSNTEEEHDRQGHPGLVVRRQAFGG